MFISEHDVKVGEVITKILDFFDYACEQRIHNEYKLNAIALR